MAVMCLPKRGTACRRPAALTRRLTVLEQPSMTTNAAQGQRPTELSDEPTHSHTTEDRDHAAAGRTAA